MSTTPTPSRARAGFTLIEILIAVAIVSVALVAVNALSATGVGLFRTTTVQTNLDTRALRVIDRLSTVLAKADAGSLVPPAPEDGTEDLLFQEVIGVVDGEREWGPVQEALFEYEQGEADDGVDNNDNGLVDEGVVVLLRNVGEADEQRVILCHGVSELLEGESSNGVDDNGNDLVDEPGFSIQWVGGVLCLRLSVEEIDSSGDLVVRTLQTSVRMRNGS